MRRRLFGAALVTVLGLWMTACRQEGSDAADGDDVTAGDVQQKAADAMETAGKLAAQEREKFVKATEKQLAAIDRKFEELKADAEAMGNELSQDMQQELSSLEDEREALSQKMSELREASKDSWQSVKSGLADAIASVEASLNDARESLQESDDDSKPVANKPAS